MSGGASERRRALARQYKESPRTMGVYVIRSTASQHVLLRASMNLDGAINRDRFELRLGCHRDASLQADWRRLGEAGVRFEVLEAIRPRPDADDDPRELLALALSLWQLELGLPGAPT